MFPPPTADEKPLLQENPHDTVLLDPGLLPLPAAAASALPYLNPADCFLHANGQPSWKLLHWLRLAAVSPQERRRCGHLLAAGERASEQVGAGQHFNPMKGGVGRPMSRVAYGGGTHSLTRPLPHRGHRIIVTYIPTSPRSTIWAPVHINMFCLSASVPIRLHSPP